MMTIRFEDRFTVPQPTDGATVLSLSAALCGRYPFLRQMPLGVSVLGTPLTALMIPPTEMHGGTVQRVLIAAAFHGQEWMTALIALRLCEDLCRAQRSRARLCGLPVSKALRDRQVWIVPMVNPDGAAIALHGSAAAGEYAPFVHDAGGDVAGLWQANARGVDINHNFNAGWAEMQALAAKTGKDRAGARQYSGPTPESEPETRALTDLCRRYPFRHVVALHSQGEEIYWQYGENTPPYSAIIAQILGAASGYTVTRPTGMASHGGFKDWYIQCFHRPGFTIELGKGVNPLPLGEMESIYHKAQEMLVLAALL